MAHVWVVEIWIRSEDGSNWSQWRGKLGLTKAVPIGVLEIILPVIWGSDKARAWVKRRDARKDAAAVRHTLLQGWGRKDFGVRVAKYVRRQGDGRAF